MLTYILKQDEQLFYQIKATVKNLKNWVRLCGENGGEMSEWICSTNGQIQ